MKEQIGLALSGGGVRALVFHAGVVRYLAEKGLLERVSSISSVSGGSLFVGLVFAHSGWRWPTSEQYLKEVLPNIRQKITSVCLQSEATRLLLLKPANWRFIFSRSNVLALAIERVWGVDRLLSALPNLPEWSANGTCAETGRRFRFKQGRCGDYELGYADAREFKVAEAMAASAAYPMLIGPLKLDASRLTWYKRPNWDAPLEEEKSIQPQFQSIHVMDGGVYDNLGMEPLFDVGRGRPKGGLDFVFVSDGGAPLARTPLPALWKLSRLARVVEITTDQIRALRVRPFVNALLEKSTIGRYIQIGTDPARLAKNPTLAHADFSGNWLESEKISKALSWPTNLKRIRSDDFDLLVRHGYETAMCIDRLAETNLGGEARL